MPRKNTMAMSVRTNVASLMAAGNLAQTNKSLSNTLGRISSGLRVNSAADDAAGLGVATNLETAASSTSQAMRNANDGISIIQTAESASNEVVDILQRMRELAVQSSSETLDDDERSYISDEFDELNSEISRIANVTEFNGIDLSDGTTTEVEVQVGIQNDSSSRITVDLGNLTTGTAGLSLSATDLSDVTGAQEAIEDIDAALDTVNGYRSDLGSVQNRLDSAINNSQAYLEALSSAQSAIQDADFAHETSEMTKMQIMQQAGVAALAQAKNMNQSVISLLS
jgi:flagellin